MAWSVGEQLPEALERLFSGEELPAKIGQAFLLVAIDDLGWPHVAMLSYGEVVALDRRTLRLGLWDGSSATRYLRRGGKATLCLADASGVYYVKGDITDLGRALEEPAPIAKLEMRIRQVLQDGDPDGEVTSGITYRSAEAPAQLLARWARQLAALRA